MNWSAQKVLVTGGASFIGAHLVDALVERGARVRIVDDLSSGRLENIQGHLVNGQVDFIQADLREPGVLAPPCRMSKLSSTWSPITVDGAT